jgi:hypothetical protein
MQGVGSFPFDHRPFFYGGFAFDKNGPENRLLPANVKDANVFRQLVVAGSQGKRTKPRLQG